MSDCEYEIEEIEVDESELTEEVYLTSLRELREEYEDGEADEFMILQLKLFVEEILERWYDDDLQKIYESYKKKRNGEKMFKVLLDKATEWLEYRVK